MVISGAGDRAFCAGTNITELEDTNLAEVCGDRSQLLNAAVANAARIAALDTGAVTASRRILGTPENQRALDGSRQELAMLGRLVAARCA